MDYSLWSFPNNVVQHPSAPRRRQVSFTYRLLRSSRPSRILPSSFRLGNIPFETRSERGAHFYAPSDTGEDALLRWCAPPDFQKARDRRRPQTFARTWTSSLWHQRWMQETNLSCECIRHVENYLAILTRQWRHGNVEAAPKLSTLCKLRRVFARKYSCFSWPEGFEKLWINCICVSP